MVSTSVDQINNPLYRCKNDLSGNRLNLCLIFLFLSRGFQSQWTFYIGLALCNQNSLIRGVGMFNQEDQLRMPG